MFHDDEPPVSLFSFQDIITSLTGIMIFFLLLLSLSILEFKEATRQDSPVSGELDQAKKKNALLTEQIAAIRSDIENYRKRLRAAQGKDEATLTLERTHLEKDIEELNSLRETLRQTLETAKRQQKRCEEEKRELLEQQKQIETARRRSEATQARIEEQKKRIAEVREKIEKRRREFQITIDSSISKTPLLIECSQEKIVIINTADRRQQVFTRRSPLVSEFISEVIRYLQGFPASRYYFVLMIKPSSAAYITYFQTQLENKYADTDYGMEPILENEGVLHE